ncbi:GNAT family N-acetyltransferase [Aureimonas leprariae]|uniref:Aminoglycoside N(6')-acetyltransferase type 1 n=2 Tax=Plantimonas leprariae TaxID=2615207 RepID=A0A7V7TUV7_9HYPH|nr:GNAT family N-acetyltransferase [Aureimonas leprariae]
MLWPEEDADAHLDDIALSFGRAPDFAAFLALDALDTPVGFAEASLRRDYVNGCKTSPVLFLEGIFVREDRRRRGLGRQLCAAVEDWGRVLGCSEFASDAPIDNVAARRFHAMLGFEETREVVYFRRVLQD